MGTERAPHSSFARRLPQNRLMHTTESYVERTRPGKRLRSRGILPEMTAEAIAQRCRDILRRVPSGVTVVAAAKGRTPDEIRAALYAGISHIGENYVQDAEGKRPLVLEPATWHMIGHLQRNKAARATCLFDWVQTVDTPDLARRLAAARALEAAALPVLVEVNIGREEHKAGVLPEAVLPFVRNLTRYPQLSVRGLMAVPPVPERPGDSRPHFRALRHLLEELNRERIADPALDVLSMGMSADWEVAVEEGATLIRLGTALFGPR